MDVFLGDNGVWPLRMVCTLLASWMLHNLEQISAISCSKLQKICISQKYQKLIWNLHFLNMENWYPCTIYNYFAIWCMETGDSRHFACIKTKSMIHWLVATTLNFLCCPSSVCRSALLRYSSVAFSAGIQMLVGRLQKASRPNTTPPNPCHKLTEPKMEMFSPIWNVKCDSQI